MITKESVTKSGHPIYLSNCEIIIPINTVKSEDGVALLESMYDLIECHAVLKLAATVSSSPTKEERIASRQKAMHGYVYLLKSSLGHYKIGSTKDVAKRLHSIECSFPHKVELVHSFETDERYRVERELQARYAEYRLAGEWFTLPGSAISEFTEITNYYG